MYKSGLLDDRISGSAYYNIALQKKDYYTENETIGTLNVIAGYKPIYDNYNNLIGIISSQTVFKQNEINQELTENSGLYLWGIFCGSNIFDYHSKYSFIYDFESHNSVAKSDRPAFER